MKTEKLNLKEEKFYTLIEDNKEISRCFVGRLTGLCGVSRYQFVNRGPLKDSYRVINSISIPADSIYSYNGKLRIKDSSLIVNIDEDNFSIDNLPNLSYKICHSEWDDREFFSILNRKLEHAERIKKRKELINKIFTKN